MESLEDFNSRRRQAYDNPLTPTTKLNGIACPKCGSEMFDTNPMMTLTSFPPQKDVGCQCGYRGYRIA